MSSKKEEKNPGEMSFLEHLEELRWHLIRSISLILILAIAAFIFNHIIFDIILLAPKNPEFITNLLLCNFGNIVNIQALCINATPLKLISIKMAGQFSAHIMVSLFAGIVLGFPFIFWEFWKFIRPALHEKEKNYTRGAVFFTSLLFITGILFGYYIITPLSVHFLGSYSVSPDVDNHINLMSYISTVITVTLASGIIFELPVVIFFLTKAGIATPEGLKKYRKHALVGILILSAIITPPDIFSQILVCLPILLLYEMSIFISRKTLKEKVLPRI
jgi:sec-independent protein translocase protein TatC